MAKNKSLGADEDPYAKRLIIEGWPVFIQTYNYGGPTATETVLWLSETGNLDPHRSIRLGGVGTNVVQTITPNDLSDRLTTIAKALGKHRRIKVEYCPRTDAMDELTGIELLPK